VRLCLWLLLLSWVAVAHAAGVNEFCDLPEKDQAYVIGGALFLIAMIGLGVYIAIDRNKK
jgi:hypothetical protein